MQDRDTPPGPFVVLTDEKSAPRTGPTMAAIVGELGKLRALVEQILRRQQQVALMVDGFGANMGRRFDVLHEESALIRVAMNRPANDAEVAEADTIPVDVEPSRGEKVRHLFALGGKWLSYGTTAAIGLRLLAKSFPEYNEAIEALLGLFGL